MASLICDFTLVPRLPQSCQPPIAQQPLLQIARKRNSLAEVGQGIQRERPILVLALMILVHKFAIAIGAFNPTVLIRDLQPDPWMPPLAAITGNAITVHDLGFRRFNVHRLAVLLAIVQNGRISRVYEPWQNGGQEPQ